MSDAANEIWAYGVPIVRDEEFLEDYAYALSQKGMARLRLLKEMTDYKVLGELGFWYSIRIDATTEIHVGEQSFTFHQVLAIIDVGIDEQTGSPIPEFESEDIGREGWMRDEDLIRMPQRELVELILSRRQPAVT
jgi:hypothetical protein